MQFRLACGVVVFALTGCFSEPPPSSGTSGEGSTGDAGSSTSTTAEGSSTTAVGDSSASGGSSGEDCDVVQFEVPAVAADVVVLVDENTSFNVLDILGANAGLAETANVAILLPQDQVPATLPPGLCDEGCGMCAKPVNRVLVPYAPSAEKNGPYAAFSQPSTYACILRGPGIDSVNSGPTKHLWMITDNEDLVLPDDFVTSVVNGPFRVHVSCPGCNPELEGMHDSVRTVVAETLGWAGDKADLDDLAPLISMESKSCAWDPGEDLPLAMVGVLDPDGIDPAELVLYPTSEASCGDDGFFEESGALFLCPEPCRLVQSFPEPLVEFLGCY